MVGAAELLGDGAEGVAVFDGDGSVWVGGGAVGDCCAGQEGAGDDGAEGFGMMRVLLWCVVVMVCSPILFLWTISV